MKKIATIICFLISINFLAKADSLSVHPGIYYTYGNYSSDASSKAFSVYVPFVFGQRHTFLAGYDNLKIITPNWDYNQQMYNLQTILNFDPFYIKLNYDYINGDYLESNSINNYQDRTNIFNLESFIRLKLFYIGLSYVHLKMNGGILQQSTDQFTARLEYLIDPRVYLSLKPSYVKVKDGRNLASFEARINYLPLNSFLIKAGAMFGKRAYYFDSDLLTIFNQEETQDKKYFGQVEYTPVKSFTFILSYIHSGFETYSINYFVAGIKAHLGS
ncbi:MAG TPA: hypothetical protein VKA26_03170 [Ignavibacteriaceae bacterium]|nr:hypothetical protein [Ignavibacteriaceae bacterium]